MPADCLFSPFDAIIAALKLIALHGPLWLFSLALAARLVRGNLDRFAAGLLIYLSTAAVVPWVLPHLSYGWLQGASLVLGAIGIALRGEFLRSRLGLGPALAGWLAFAAVTVALWVLKARLPFIDHDPLTYQLYFAASWLREGHIFIVPTPFGDPSQAYGPAAASLYYLWLMAPVGSDLLAVTGGLPFYLLAVLAAAMLGRELGARPDRLWAAAIFATGVVSYQGFTALTDAAVAGLFASSIAFSLRAGREKSAGAAAMAALSVGLMTGVKISGLPLLPLLAPALGWAARQGGRTMKWGWIGGAIGGAAVALPWYLRNLIVAGNPIFPIRLKLPGVTLPGLYGRPEMLGWVFHYTGWDKWKEQVTGNFSLQVLAMAAAAVLLLIYERRSERTEGTVRPPAPALAYVLVLPLLIDRLIWWVLPYQELRFWAPIMPLLMAVMAAAYSRRGWLLLAGFLVTSYSFDAVVKFLERPDKNLVSGLLSFGLPVLVIGGFFLFQLLLRRVDGQRVPAWTVPAAGLLLAAVGVLVLLPGHPERQRRMFRYYENSAGWTALPCNAPSTVAYTGANVPYPLFGARLGNRVVYVSPAGDVMPEAHKLMAALNEPMKFRTAEPAIERLFLCPRRWLDGLRRAGAGWLMVMKVPKNELYNIDHDREGWPTEKQWADAAPEIFQLLFQDQFSRMYVISPQSGDISAWPDCVARPADAPSARLRSPELSERFFPLFRRLNPR